MLSKCYMGELQEKRTLSSENDIEQNDQKFIAFGGKGADKFQKKVTLGVQRLGSMVADTEMTSEEDETLWKMEARSTGG